MLPMGALYQETLLCDPIVIPPVAGGPYPYPIADCDNNLGCSDGPLLCRPGDGDDPVEAEPCCDQDTIPNIANISTRIRFERDLFDPGSLRTIKDLALIKGLNPSNYTPYVRNFRTSQLIETSYNLVIDTKMSILLIENELDTTNGRRRIMNHIAGHREILPARFTWPDCDPTTTDCWPQNFGS